jgi:hypothetical protein
MNAHCCFFADRYHGAATVAREWVDHVIKPRGLHGIQRIVVGPL